MRAEKRLKSLIDYDFDGLSEDDASSVKHDLVKVLLVVRKLNNELNWTSARDGFPKGKGDYLCRIDNGNGVFALVVFFTGHGWLTINRITHYKPITLP